MASHRAVRHAVRRRVVVTGVGMVTPLGVSAATTWRRLLRGDCGVTALNDPWAAQIPSRVAAKVDSDAVREALEGAAERLRLAPFVQYALLAAREAVASAGGLGGAEPDRSGVAVGSGIGHVDGVAAAHSALGRGYRRLSPYFVPSVLVNMAAGHVSIEHGLRGPCVAPATACATGLHAVGDAARLIERGDADLMLAGGAEGSVDALSVAGFARMRALSTAFNDRPGEASRPFDELRDGFVLGEGAAVLVLEEAGAAEARGARAVAEFSGYGMSGDASHITAPPADGDGAGRAMAAALRDAGLRPADIGYVNAHATSTPLGDAAEAAALVRVFGPAGPAVSSAKGALGHALGAAGAIEAALTVLALRDLVLPPTRGLERAGAEFGGVDLVAAGAGRPAPALRHALTNSFGFGGTNASAVFSRAGCWGEQT